MKIKTLALSALMTLAVTSAFAQDNTNAQPTSMTQGSMMAPSMEDQDYSGWRETYFRLATTPAGAVSTIKALEDDAQIRDEYDHKVFKHLMRMASAEHRTPSRPFDSPWPITSQAMVWQRVEMKLNAFRRELIREDEARRMQLDRSMGRTSTPRM